MTTNKTEQLLLDLYNTVLINVGIDIGLSPLHVDIKKIVYQSLKCAEGVSVEYLESENKWFINYSLSETNAVCLEVDYEDLGEFYDDIQGQ